GVPYIARRYAEEHSPVPLVMRSTFFSPRPDPPRGGDEGKPPFRQVTDRTWDRPQLRILHQSGRGVIASDNRLFLFRNDVDLPTKQPVKKALFIEAADWSPAPATVVLAGPHSLSAIEPDDGKLRWHIEPTPTTPTLTPLNRPVLACASPDAALSLGEVSLEGR